MDNMVLEPVTDLQVEQAKAQLISAKLAEKIDEFCKLKVQVKKDEERIAELLKDIAPHITETAPLVTTKWCLTKVVVKTMTLDVTALKEKYSARWVKKWSKEGSRTTYKPTSLVAKA